MKPGTRIFYLKFVPSYGKSEPIYVAVVTTQSLTEVKSIVETAIKKWGADDIEDECELDYVFKVLKDHCMEVSMIEEDAIIVY